MDERQARQIEQVVDGAAAVLLGAAVGASGLRLGLSLLAAALVAAVSGLAGWRGLRLVPPQDAEFAVAAFALPDVRRPQTGELLLGEEDRIGAAELVLDAIAAHVGSESRVVRLFDAAAMPTAGELGARIDRHLGQPAPDDSKALFDALADLRRALN